MIFSFDGNPKDGVKFDDAFLAEFVDHIISNGHFIDCTEEWLDHIYRVVMEHGGSNAKKRFEKFMTNSPSGQLRKYLRTINTGDLDAVRLDRLATLPALVVLENARFEWPIYRRIIKLAAAADRTFKDVFNRLADAERNLWIEEHQAGGAGEVPGEIQRLEERRYKDIGPYKINALLDRDTDRELNDDGSPLFDKNKNNAFTFFCGKKHNEITYDDIYSLPQPSTYTWHMWHKRAVENYLSNDIFQKHRLSTAKLPATDAERDYFLINGTSMPGYSKNSLPIFANDLSWKLLNNHCKRFSIKPNMEVTELQLLLLKWAGTI